MIVGYNKFSNNYQQLAIKYDKSHEVLWASMHQKNMIPCFNGQLIHEISHYQNEIEQSRGVITDGDKVMHIKYVVASSLTPGVFNLGGHLALMRELIATKNLEALRDYAIKGIDTLAHRIFRFNVPSITTITLLQGQTLGAGLEAALTSDVIIAERNSLLGFPEILFNMFPGMGGYTLTKRKIGSKLAEEMILKGKIYTAEQAYEMGLVDVLVENGQGVEAVYDWIESNNRYSTGFLAMQKVKNCESPITHDVLVEITNIWLDTALRLSEHDLSIMDRFIAKQVSQYLPARQDTSNVVTLRQSA
ncbi:MAG: crotonase/enoyl-CoA hydratase family protein [Methylophilaceae bacterium]